LQPDDEKRSFSFSTKAGQVNSVNLTPKLGTTAGLVLSGLFLSVLILAVAYLSLPWFGARCFVELIGIGLGWLALIFVFEFSLGLWQGKSWKVMFEAYTFKGGQHLDGCPCGNCSCAISCR
jgi:hypothetical protein